MRYLLGLSILCSLLLPSTATAQPSCSSHKHIRAWSRERVLRNDFTIVQEGTQASVTYPHRSLRLALSADPTTNATTIARVTEVDSSLSFCWQPAGDDPVIMQTTLRFDQAAPPLNLTEVAFLWNAPGLTQRLPSVIGVSRDHGAYTALIAQDFDPTTGNGLFQRSPMPGWLHAADWHTIRIELTTTHARVSVEQHGHKAEIVTATLLHPPEPLAAELSVDNDNFPEGHLPVLMPDAMEVRKLDIRGGNAKDSPIYSMVDDR